MRPVGADCPGPSVPPAMRLAAAIAKPPPLAMGLTKQAIDLGEEVALTTGIRIELAAIERNLAEGGWREGLAAFARKDS